MRKLIVDEFQILQRFRCRRGTTCSNHLSL